MATVNDIFGVGPAVELAVVGKTSPHVPKTDPAYEFRDDLVRALLVWWDGRVSKNYLVQGPTGSGKSSLIEQFCSRMGVELYRYACHQRTDFNEMLGQMIVRTDGSTEFVLGPLPRAMKEGAVFALDELNFMPPGVVGALNSVLDGVPLLIPQTGELIDPHKDFRFAATGNAIADDDQAALYRGTQRMNPALLYRFLKSKVGYLDEIKEIAALHRNAPNLDLGVVKTLVKLAQDVRDAHVKGEMSSVLSTRTLVMTVKLLELRAKLVLQNPMDQVKFALHLSFLDAINPSEAAAITKLLDKIGIKLEGSTGKGKGRAAQAAPPEKPSAPKAVRAGFASCVFAFNPDRQGTGTPAFYGASIHPDRMEGRTFNGTFGDGQPVLRWSKTKSLTTCLDDVRTKVQDRGYEVVITEFEVPGVLAETLLAMVTTVQVGLDLAKAKGSVEIAPTTSQLVPDEAKAHLSYWLYDRFGVLATWA